MSNFEITVLGIGEENDPNVLDMLEQAENDAAQEGAQVRVNFRWARISLLS